MLNFDPIKSISANMERSERYVNVEAGTPIES